MHHAPPNKDLKHGARRILEALEPPGRVAARRRGDLTVTNVKNYNQAQKDFSMNQVMLSLRVGVKVKRSDFEPF